MGLDPISIGLIGSAVGGLAGAAGGLASKKSEKTSQLEVSDPDVFERRLREAQQGFFSQLEQLNAASGLGTQDVAAATGAQRDLAAQLQGMVTTGGLPGQADITAGRQFAEQAFAGQRERLGQSFTRQQQQASRQAAFLGREQNDPILQNLLAQEQIGQENILSADQAAAAQQFAMQLPGQRLGFAQSRADILGGLANQAFQNRQSLLSLGNTLSQQERQFRLQTGLQRGTQTDFGSQSQGLLGGLMGAASGFSTGASLGGLFGGGIKGPGGLGGAAQAAGAASSQGFAPSGVTDFISRPTGTEGLSPFISREGPAFAGSISIGAGGAPIRPRSSMGPVQGFGESGQFGSFNTFGPRFLGR